MHEISTVADPTTDNEEYINEICFNYGVTKSSIRHTVGDDVFCIDWTYWLNKPEWTPEQAVCLIYGVNPLSYDKVKNQQHVEMLRLTAETKGNMTPYNWQQFSFNQKLPSPVQMRSLKESLLNLSSEANVNIPNKKSKKTSNVDPIFIKFKNLHSNEISFIMMKDHYIKMVIQGKTLKVLPSHFSLKPKSRDWDLLEKCAINEGLLTKALRSKNTTSNLELERTKIKTLVSRLRSVIKGSMGLINNPITHQKSTGYQFNFKLMSHEMLTGSLVTKGHDAYKYVDKHIKPDDAAYYDKKFRDDKFVDNNDGDERDQSYERNDDDDDDERDQSYERNDDERKDLDYFSNRRY